MKHAPLIAALCLASCASLSPDGSSPSRGSAAAEAASLHCGHFSSAAQAAADPENYRDIRIVVCPIWTERVDGPWLYVEKASVLNLKNPFRQHVYRIVAETEARVRREVFDIETELRMIAGAFVDAKPLAQLSPDDLVPKSGCAVTLLRVGRGRWAGSTDGVSCPADYADAAYMTSHVALAADRLTIWDRGFSEDGTYRWGAELGPYEFDRIR